MNKKNKKKVAALRKKAPARTQLNMSVNPKVIELLLALKKHEPIKLALKGKASNHRLIWMGLSLVGKKYHVKFAKKQMELFES